MSFRSGMPRDLPTKVIASMSAYTIEHLTKIYRSGTPPANDDISLIVQKGDLLGIFGPNGAGKTTLVRQMIALLKPSSGMIRLFDQDIVRHPHLVAPLVSYYGQRVVALRNHSFYEVIFITGILRGLPSASARQQAQALMQRFHLEELAGRRLAKLSGGEQRLAVLLGAFMAEPRVLILDEPTNELDPSRRQLLWAYLQELNQKQGMTVILTTHNLIEAEQVVDRVAIIDQGRLVAVGTPGELKRRVAEQVRLEVRLRDGLFPAVEQRLASIEGSHQMRPGRWQITAPQDQATTLLPRLVDLVGFDALDDFRLITPTMEDVYVQLTGRYWEERSGDKV